MASQTNRNVAISLIRMICTLMVVILHIFQQLESQVKNLYIVTEWFNLGLVMFFCISAFLYSHRTITDAPKWLLHRYTEIAIPSMIVGIATIVFFLLFGNISASQIIGTLISSAGLEVYAPNPWMFIQLWFLTYILFFYITVPFIQKINCQKCSEIKFWSIFVIIVITVQVVLFLLEQLFKIPFLSTGILLRLYLPYFVFKRYDINGNKIKKVMYFFTFFAAVVVLLTCYIRYFHTFEGVLEQVSELLFVYAQSIAGFVLFFWLYKLFSKLKDYSTVLKISDRYSYNVYLTHCLFISYNTSLIRTFENKLVGITLALVLTAVSSVMVYYLTQLVKKPLSRKAIKTN